MSQRGAVVALGAPGLGDQEEGLVAGLQLQDELVNDWAKIDTNVPDRCIELLTREIAAKKVESDE